MESPTLTRFLKLLLASACMSCVGALDISLDEIQCDQSLPVYASLDDVRLTCDDGNSTRCSFGSEVNIRGTLQYNSLNQYTYNGTGYATANLRLMSIEYSLFEEYPIDFCGDWITAYNKTDDGMTCPYVDGLYYFNVPYTLPFDDDDITTWFASGWSGASTLQIRNGYSDDSSLLADCTLNWHTYVTPSNADGWKTMPSAAQTGIALASVIAAILCCCTYIVCCRRRKTHVTDKEYYNDYEIYDEKKQKKRRSRKSKVDIDNVEASRVG